MSNQAEVIRHRKKIQVKNLMDQIFVWRQIKLKELHDHEQDMQQLEMSRENAKSIFSIQDFP